MLLAGLLELLEVEVGRAVFGLCGEVEDDKVEGEKSVGEERWESFWQLCLEAGRVGGENEKTLLSFVCECHHFQTTTCQLVLAALSIGGGGSCCGVLHERENVNWFLLEFHKQFWTNRIQYLFSKHASSLSLKQPNTLNAAWSQCIKHISLLYTIQEMHHILAQAENDVLITSPTNSLRPEINHTEAAATADSTSSLFLCSDISNSLAKRLAHTLPCTLHSMYLGWWSNDTEHLNITHEIPTIHKEEIGHIIKVDTYIPQQVLY